MGNTDKFEMIANIYDTSERIQIAKVSSNAIREYVVDAKRKNAIDFGCGTGLVGMDLLNDFKSILFLDTSQNMIHQIEQKISSSNIQNAATLCFDFEKDSLSDLHADYIFMAQVLLHINDVELVLSRLYEVIFNLKLFMLEVKFSWGMMHLCLFLILRNRASNISFRYWI